MKYFDSIKDNKWIGQNFNIKDNCLVILKTAKLEQKIKLDKGNYSIRIVGKKRTGNGSLLVSVKSPDGEKFLEQVFQFTKSAWSEASFDFSSNQKTSNAIIEFSRDKNMFGSVEIARILIESASKENYTPAAIRKELNSAPKPVRYIPLDATPVFNKKKIAIIIPYTIYGGAEIYLTNLLNNLEDSHDISLIYLQKNNISNFVTYKSANHVESKSLENLAAYLKTFNFDYIIYYNRLDVCQLLEKLSLNQDIKAKLIEIYHSNFSWPGAVANEKNRKAVNLLVTVSQNLGHDISVPNNAKKIVVPTGIDLDRFKFRNKQEIKDKLKINYKNIIGTVARLSKEKNISYLIELAQQMRNFDFIIIGDGNEKNNLLDKIKQNKVSNVHLLGFKANPELYYNIFDAFILPSNIEGLPISILESMASEVPVYCTNVGDIASLIKDNYNGFFLNLNAAQDSELIRLTHKNTSIIKQAKKDIGLNHDIKNNVKMFFDAILSLDENYIRYEKQEFQFLLPGRYL